VTLELLELEILACNGLYCVHSPLFFWDGLMLTVTMWRMRKRRVKGNAGLMQSCEVFVMFLQEVEA